MSTIHSYTSREILQKADYKTEDFGKNDPISLAVVSNEKIANTIGEQLQMGAFGVIYRVNNSNPPRVYKVIKSQDFESGNEIRISLEAADLKVGPKVHQVFVIQKLDGKYICIEMDDVGKASYCG